MKIKSLNTNQLKTLLEESLKINNTASSMRKSDDSHLTSSSSLAQLLTQPSVKSSELLNLVYKSSTPRELAAEYKDLMKDPLLKSALQLYADDASNISSLDDILVQSSSDNPSINQLLKDYLIDELKITSSTLWNWAFNLVTYGDIFIERMHSDDDGDRVVIYPHPEWLTDIRYKGKSLLFLESVESEEDYVLDSSSLIQELADDVTYDSRSIIVPNTKYVHGALLGTSNTERIMLEQSVEGSDETVINAYEVWRGESILENIRFIYRIIKLLEDSLWLARLKNSQRIDIINVDLGDRIDDKTTPDSVALAYKDKINQEINISYGVANTLLESSMSRSNQAAALSNIIVNPVYKGRGQITHDLIDGSLDVSNIKDMEYFTNKLFAGLRIPKPMLGWEESLGSALGGGGSRLEELDKRYHRSVVRVTSVIEEVLTRLCELHLEELGYEYSVSIIVKNKARDMTDRFEEIQSQIDSIQPLSDVLEEYILNGELPVQSRLVYLELYKKIMDPEIYNLLYTNLTKSAAPSITDLSYLQDIKEIIDPESGESLELRIAQLDGFKPVLSDKYYKELVDLVTSYPYEVEEDPEATEDEGSEEDTNNKEMM